MSSESKDAPLKHVSEHIGEPLGSRGEAEAALGAEIGICGDCTWARLLSSRSSSFLRCGASDAAAGMARYPMIPVLECVCFSESGKTSDSADLD